MSGRRRSLSPSPRRDKDRDADEGVSPRRRSRSLRLSAAYGLQSESSRATFTEHLLPSVPIPPLILPNVLVTDLDSSVFHLTLDRVPVSSDEPSIPPSLSRCRSRESASSSVSSSSVFLQAPQVSSHPSHSTPCFISTSPPPPPSPSLRLATSRSPSPTRAGSTSTPSTTAEQDDLLTADETTAEELITRLLSTNGFGDHDAELVRAVLAVHEYFIKTDVLLSLLLSLCCPELFPRHTQAEEEAAEEEISSAVLATLQERHDPVDLQARALQLLDVWMTADVRLVSEAGRLGPEVMARLLQGQTDCTNAAHIVASVEAARLVVKAKAEGPFSTAIRQDGDVSWVRGMLLEQLSTAELAYALTWCEWSLLAQIPQHEFLLKRHTKIEHSPNYHRLTDHFNRIVAWLQSCLLLEPSVAVRAALLSRLIDLAVQLRALQNLSGVCQVIYAVNSSPVSRLADTWALVPAADRAREQELTALVVPIGNFRNLRALLRTAAPPVVPPLFLAGKDIYSLEEATETRASNGKLNWSKLRKIARLSLDAIRPGQHAYPAHAHLEPETLKVFARFLMNPTPLEATDRLSRLSILCQPVQHK